MDLFESHCLAWGGGGGVGGERGWGISSNYDCSRPGLVNPYHPSQELVPFPFLLQICAALLLSSYQS